VKVNHTVLGYDCIPIFKWVGCIECSMAEVTCPTGHASFTTKAKNMGVFTCKCKKCGDTFYVNGSKL